MGPDKLKVSLSREELEELGVDYDSLDYQNPATREILLGLLERGRKEAGFSPRRAKLYIEVFPSEGGGCIIYFTRLPNGELMPAGRFVPGAVPAVFAFGDTEVLIQACAGLHELYAHRVLESALYRVGQGYRLVIYPLDYADNLSSSFLGEYGTYVGRGAVLAAYCREHGALLIEKDAVAVLAGLS